MPRTWGPLLGIQGSRWRSWRHCSLELGTERTSPGEGPCNHLQPRVQHPGTPPQASEAISPLHQQPPVSLPSLFFTSSPSKRSLNAVTAPITSFPKTLVITGLSLCLVLALPKSSGLLPFSCPTRQP